MNADYTEQRVKMVDGQVRTTDVTNATLLDAMLAVPREVFVEDRLRGISYIDEDIQIAAASAGSVPRYLMEPSPFAKLVQLAEISPSDRVLDVGCGTGYSSAVLAILAKAVVALESDPALASLAVANLATVDAINITVVEGPLGKGHEPHGPYDVIFVGGAVEEVPAALFAQLREGGRLVAVEGAGNAGVARLFVKSNGMVTGRRGFNAAVKPLPGFERARIFEF